MVAKFESYVLDHLRYYKDQEVSILTAALSVWGYSNIL